MRDLEELYADIDGFTLERYIRREVKYTRADIPDLERENEADNARLKKLDAKPDKTDGEKLEEMEIMWRMNGRTRLIRQIEKLPRKRSAYVLSWKKIKPDADRDLAALERHVRATWTIREIMFFQIFARGCRKLVSPSGWECNCAGYPAKTHEGQDNLARLFDRLVNYAWLYMGALTYTEMKPDSPAWMLITQDKSNFEKLTLRAVAEAMPTPDNVPPGLKKMLENLTENLTTEVKAEGAATRAAIDKLGKQRSDKGGKHGKTARGWRTQADVAADFSRSAKRIGGRWYGKAAKDKVKEWERRYPKETKREKKSGYHAGLRNCPNPTPEIKQAYWDAAANWNAYWKAHNSAFAGWMKKNPHGTHRDFLKVWQRPGKTVHRNDTDKTTRYGADTSLANALDNGDFDNGT